MPELVEALYDFEPQSDGDLELRKGQQIEVHEHLSADWMRGRDLATGKEGVFPANYVRPAEKASSFSRPAVAAPGGRSEKSEKSDYPQAFNERDQYQPPPPSWGQQTPPQYGQPQQQYQQYQPPQQQYAPPQQQQQPQPQPEQHHHHRFGGIAKRFGDSVVFGAGATLGSDLINKIF